MKTYIKTLKEKPHHHRKRFALLVSGVFTLVIFAGWSMVMFNGPQSVSLAQEETQYESGPFSSLGSTLAASFVSIRNNIGEIKATLINNGQ